MLKGATAKCFQHDRNMEQCLFISQYNAWKTLRMFRAMTFRAVIGVAGGAVTLSELDLQTNEQTVQVIPELKNILCTTTIF